MPTPSRPTTDECVKLLAADRAMWVRIHDETHPNVHRHDEIRRRVERHDALVAALRFCRDSAPGPLKGVDALIAEEDA